MRAAASRSAPATGAIVSSYNLLDSAAASPSPATSASKRSSWRRGSSIAAAVSRSSAAGARRRRSASTASGLDRRRQDDRANYGFQPALRRRPRSSCGRRGACWCLRGGLELSQWDQRPGARLGAVDRRASTRRRRSPASARAHLRPLTGHDWRRLAHVAGICAARRLLRRHPARLRRSRTRTSGSARSTTRSIQHIPLLRDAWVLVAARARRDHLRKDDQQIPFFMLPALGGGSTLRGFASWRFRDRHSLLLQAEWRVIVNRFLDMALFY